MSIRIMTWVLDEAPVKDSTQTLILLCLADWANDAGHCWPSIESIAARARCSESTARRSVRALEKAGLLMRAAPSKGRAANLYRIIRASGGDPSGTAPDLPESGYPQARNPVTMPPCQIDRVGGATLAPVTGNPGMGDTPTLAPVTPEPPLNRQEPPAAAREASGGDSNGTAARAADEAVDGTAPVIDALAAACRAADLTASWRRLTVEQRATIAMLVDVHGIPALVAEARRYHQPTNPARYATAWLGLWKDMPVRGLHQPQQPAESPACGECNPNRWIEDPDTGLPIRRCHCHVTMRATHPQGGAA